MGNVSQEAIKKGVTDLHKVLHLDSRHSQGPTPKATKHEKHAGAKEAGVFIFKRGATIRLRGEREPGLMEKLK